MVSVDIERVSADGHLHVLLLVEVVRQITEEILQLPRNCGAILFERSMNRCEVIVRVLKELGLD